MSPREPFTTFWLGDLLLAMRATDVREVIENPPLTPVPLVSPVLRGVFNLRGELVTVLDLRRRLGLSDEPSTATMHMIIGTADGTLSLQVDRQGDVVELDRSAFETPPQGIAETAHDCVVGAFKLPDRLLILLDTERTLDLSGFEDDGGAPTRMETNT